MLKIIISGCNGYMGRTVAAQAALDSGLEVSAGFDINAQKQGSFPVYSDPMEFGGTADTLIDFSTPSALNGLLEYGKAKNLPLILCTTGYSAEQLDAIRHAAESIPIFRSGNMSLGVNLVAALVKRACAALGPAFDVEIIERHHRRKIDAPSGTALLLADAAAAALPYEPERIYERQSKRAPRGEREIGISSMRGGTIVGEHEVVFAGLDEVIEIKHTAYSRDVFAAGALRAAKLFAQPMPPGLYGMADLLGDV